MSERQLKASEFGLVYRVFMQSNVAIVPDPKASELGMRFLVLQ